MCGIIGSNISTEIIEKGLKAMNRGNDGIAFASNADVSFGFMRHSVVGGDSGLQPLSDENYMLVFNGELFNFKNVADSLNLKLCCETSDSEVLFNLLCTKGIRALEGLNLMAAGALYSKNESRVTLFRDWVGEMPLHYALITAGKWLFASTRESVKIALGIDDKSIFEVLPGTLVHLSTLKANVNIEKISSSNNNAYPDELQNISLNDAAKLVRTSLETSANQRFWCHSPSAVMVSGGIDSTITLFLTLARWPHNGPLPIYTFHCSDEPITKDSDIYHAKLIAEYFGSKVDHRIISVSGEQILQSIEETTKNLEDIRNRDFNIVTSIYNRFIAEAMAADGIKVAYEGEGADEALASYDPWGSYTADFLKSGSIEFRTKMIKNLHKGVLLRTSKIMMHYGPVECRSYFLDQNVSSLLTNLPIEIVRCNGHRKGILIKAFSDVLPEFLLNRPKARPQDATGISKILSIAL